MLQSPAKRRRLNDTTPGANSDTNPDASMNQQPTTPTRASYLSPTKSSLSRSHPHLINQTTGRSSNQTGGKLLRDEILRPPSNTSHTVGTVESPALNVNTLHHNEGERNEGQATPNSAHTAAVDASQTHSSNHPPSPLRGRQPQQQSRLSSPENGTPLPQIFKPMLVPKPSTASRSVTRNRSEDLDLPPTPVQLGLSNLPDKPRGLASSSSPRGSKVGSGKQRRRRNDGPITSSPLKPKVAGRSGGEGDDLDIEQSLVNEAQESDMDDSREIGVPDPIEEAQENEADNLPADLIEKESTLRTLRERLEELQMEVKQLEAAVEKDEIDDSTLALLLDSPVEAGNAAISSGNIARGEEKAMQYLTLFAPGDLRLTSSTETKKVRGRTKIVHLLSLAPPPPWPVHALMFAFEVVVDAEDARVEKVSRKHSTAHPARKGPPTGINKWVSQRLEHPLHQLDVGGVAWGLGQWFSASTERARILRQLDLQYNMSSERGAEMGKELTERDAITLIPYLHQTQVQINVPREGKSLKKRILLVWDINIDWTGEVKSAIDIAASGVSAKSGRGLKEVFGSLLPNKGVVMAVEHVLALLQSDDGVESTGRGSARKRKRKRVVL